MAKRMGCTYGPTQSGKTTWWLRVGRYIHERTGKKTRWYLGDGGGETIRVAGALVEDGGFVELCRYDLWKHPFETSITACEGGWPADPKDPESPWLPPQGDLNEKYGLLVYEGLNSFCDYLMGSREGGFAWMASQKKWLNAEPAPQWQDGGMAIGGNSRGHYGFTQRRIKDLVQRTERFQGWVGWTAHEQQQEDDKRDKLIGPATAGSAITGIIGASFGHVIHMDAATTRRKEKDPVTQRDIERIVIERRAYTRRHLDPDGQHFIQYLAGCRVPDDLMPEYIAPPDPLKFYSLLEAAEKEIVRRDLESFEKIDLAV